MVMNFNRATLGLEPVNVAVNDAIERAAAAKAELPRPYLGASIVGDDCLRKIQFDWWCKPTLASRVRDIFDRGHYFEELARQRLIAAGLKFAPSEVLAFSAVNGCLRGHADGIVIAGPNPLNGVLFSYPFLWEHKTLNAKNWRAVERDGLEKAFPKYAAQVALYQAYLNKTNPALFTRRSGPTALPSLSRRPAPVSSFRAPTAIRTTGAAAFVPIARSAGEWVHEPSIRNHHPTRRASRLQARRSHSSTVLKQRW
jgi:hypothetical protein